MTCAVVNYFISPHFKLILGSSISVPFLTQLEEPFRLLFPEDLPKLCEMGLNYFPQQSSRFFFFSFEQEMLILRPLSDLLPFPRDLIDSWCSDRTSSLDLTICSLEKYRTFSCCNVNTFLFCQHWVKQN